MEGSWDLFEVWSYDEYLTVFPTRDAALRYIKRLVADGTYHRVDLVVRQISG